MIRVRGRPLVHLVPPVVGPVRRSAWARRWAAVVLLRALAWIGAATRIAGRRFDARVDGAGDATRVQAQSRAALVEDGLRQGPRAARRRGTCPREHRRGRARRARRRAEGRAGGRAAAGAARAQGLERARDGRFDIVFGDVRMPRMTGVEPIERLRADPAARGLPVQAYDFQRLEERALSLLASAEAAEGADVRQGMPSRGFRLCDIPRIRGRTARRLAVASDYTRTA